MPYEKQNFKNGDVLMAEQLNAMEDGIVGAFAEIPKFKVKSLELPASAWSGSDGIFSQVVTLDGITAYSKVDLLPSPEQLHELLLAEISLTTANSDGAITVFAIGAAPTSDYTMQALVTEVTVE